MSDPVAPEGGAPAERAQANPRRWPPVLTAIVVAVLDPAAPEGGAPAERAEANPRRWPPVLTAIVVAVLGVVLGSWLLPAFTRQWDDRQKVGDLKAALVAEMAASTGGALLDAQAFSYASGSARPSEAEIAAALREWSVTALQIRARVDAYFGPAATDAWALLAYYINSTLSRAYSSNGVDAFVAGRQAVETPSESLEDLFGKFYSGDTPIDDLAAELLRQEQCFARSILAMHVIGYSTTWHDVLSDLLPWVEADASRDTTTNLATVEISTTPAQTAAGACPNAMRGRAAS